MALRTHRRSKRGLLHSGKHITGDKVKRSAPHVKVKGSVKETGWHALETG